MAHAENMITLLGHMIETRFLHVAAERGDLYQVVGEVEEVLPVLERRVAAMLEPPAAVADTNGLP